MIFTFLKISQENWENFWGGINMENIGATYKMIRKNKKITQSAVCSDNLSRTSLSKFENDRLIPTLYSFTKFLEKIDMNYDEFFFICNNYENKELDELLDEFYLIKNNTEIHKIESLKEKCSNFLENNSNSLISDMINILNCLLLLQKDEEKFSCITKISVAKIWERISNMDTWFLNEIKFLNHILFYFQIDTAIEIGKKLIFNIKRYDKFHGMANIKISIYINLAYMLELHENISKSQTYLDIAMRLSKENKRYDLYAIAQYRLGNITFNKKMMQLSLDLLSLLEEHDLMNALITEGRKS